MFEKEDLRNAQLIEEREEYENSFLNIEDITKSEETDFQISLMVFFHERFEIKNYETDNDYMDFAREFDGEDYIDNIRDEQLIEERLAYEASCKLNIPDELFKKDPFDILIESYIEAPVEFECPDYDYLISDVPYYDDFFDEYYYEEVDVSCVAFCGGHFCYFPSDNDSFDSLDECDYPEGPEENLNGVEYPFYQIQPDYSFECVEYPQEFYECPEPDFEIIQDYGFYEYETEDSHMDNLINERLAEEKDFYNFVKENEFKDDYFLPSYVEDIIFT